MSISKRINNFFSDLISISSHLALLERDKKDSDTSSSFKSQTRPKVLTFVFSFNEAGKKDRVESFLTSALKHVEQKITSSFVSQRVGGEKFKNVENIEIR